MSIVGNDTVGVAVEVPIRLTSQIPANANSPITVTLAGNPIAYIFGNGTFAINSSRWYTSGLTNATVQVIVPGGNNGNILHMQFNGTLRGDTSGDGTVGSNDALITTRTYLRLVGVSPTYDYMDVGAPIGQIGTNDALIILRNYLGLQDY